MTTLNLTDSKIDSLWSEGNNAGDGYAVGEATMEPFEAAEAEGFTDIRTTGHGVVARNGDRWVAICDSHGPWAVDIPDHERTKPMTITHIEFQTAAQLIAAIQKLAGGVLSLDEIYVQDLAGDDLTEVALRQETLSDGSVVFNLVLSEAL